MKIHPRWGGGWFMEHNGGTAPYMVAVVSEPGELPKRFDVFDITGANPVLIGCNMFAGDAENITANHYRGSVFGDSFQPGDLIQASPRECWINVFRDGKLGKKWASRFYADGAFDCVKRGTIVYRLHVKEKVRT